MAAAGSFLQGRSIAVGTQPAEARPAAVARSAESVTRAHPEGPRWGAAPAPRAPEAPRVEVLKEPLSALKSTHLSRGRVSALRYQAFDTRCRRRLPGHGL